MKYYVELTVEQVLDFELGKLYPLSHQGMIIVGRDVFYALDLVDNFSYIWDAS